MRVPVTTHPCPLILAALANLPWLAVTRCDLQPVTCNTHWGWLKGRRAMCKGVYQSVTGWACSEGQSVHQGALICRWRSRRCRLAQLKPPQAGHQLHHRRRVAAALARRLGHSSKSLGRRGSRSLQGELVQGKGMSRLALPRHPLLHPAHADCTASQPAPPGKARQGPAARTCQAASAGGGATPSVASTLAKYSRSAPSWAEPCPGIQG